MQQSLEQVVELVTNLDDASGQVVGHAVQQLLAAGALDVWTTPIGMKKNRPGIMLSVLCPPALQQKLTVLLIELTGTFGVRRRAWERQVLQRRAQTLETDFGPIEFKIGLLEGRPLIAAPEYESAAAAADRRQAPLRSVLDAARAAAQAWLKQQGGPTTRSEVRP